MFASKDQFFTRSAAGYQLTRSLRFRASASAYLNRTLSAPTNQAKWTLVAWVKKAMQATQMAIMSTGTGSSDTTRFDIYFQNTDTLVLSGGTTNFRVSNQVFRDPSAWGLLVIACDTTQGTEANKLKCYWNQDAISWATTNTITTCGLNTAAASRIAQWASGGGFFDGNFAEFYFIDGQQLDPTSFSVVDNATGVTVPKKYTGTYGNNGFYLPFTDTSSTTNLVKDSSGNGNNWTPNNISLTAGVTYDSMIDVPYCTGQTGGTQPSGNYCVISPIDENFTTSTAVVSDGNLKFALSSTPANQQVCRGTQAGTTKFYFEVVTLSVGAGLAFGVKTTGAQLTSSGGLQAAAAWEIICTNGNKWNGSSTAYGSAYTTNDIGMCAVDPVNGKIWFGKNGTWFASGDPVAGTNAAFTNVVSSVQPLFECGTSSDSQAANFGQRPFTYTPPSGYSALCAPNLATPTIKNGAGYMAATTYTGTGASQSVTNTVSSTSFKPDLVWIKSRSAATNNNLFDAIRGTTNYLISNSTAANASNANTLTAFNSNGFTVGTDASSIGVNVNTATYVGWQWLAGAGTTSSNTNGSITSTVCVNTTSGFSVVTYTGTGANATVGHGLGVALNMVIVKRRDTTGNWATWHTSIANTNYLLLNTTAYQASGTTYWNSTSPTSSVFSIGTSTDVNANTGTYVAYCFAPIAGYSAFGSYSGNSSTDGVFIYCGFRPRWLVIKDYTGGAGNWCVIDTARTPYNTNMNTLFPNSSGVEDTTSNYLLDVLSNGFKLRTSYADVNTSGQTYIYAAFAENPFNYANAR